jgi:hypothetical protein
VHPRTDAVSFPQRIKPESDDSAAVPVKQPRVTEPDPAQVPAIESSLAMVRAELAAVKVERDKYKQSLDECTSRLEATAQERDALKAALDEAVKERDAEKDNAEFFRKNAENVTLDMEAVRQKVRAVCEGVRDTVRDMGMGLDFAVQTTLMNDRSRALAGELHALLVKNDGTTSDGYLSESIQLVGAMIGDGYPNGALAKLADICQLVHMRGVFLDGELDSMHELCRSQDVRLAEFYGLSRALDDARLQIRDLRVVEGLVKRSWRILKYRLFTLEREHVKLQSERLLADVNCVWLAAFDCDEAGGDAGGGVQKGGGADC